MLGIAIKSEKRGPMQTLDSAYVSLKRGVEYDFRGKPGKRQVTVLSQKSWSLACAALLEPLEWTSRRANLLVDDLELFESTGKIIKIGELSLLITGETDPCSRMNEAAPGLFDALAVGWRGGVCCQVINEGRIAINDKVVIVRNSDETNKSETNANKANVNEASENETVIAETQRWIKDIVIGNNFCPFAAKPFIEDRIHYFVSPAEDEKALVDDVISEMVLLRDANPAEIETTILIVPNCFQSFDDYNQFLSLVDVILEKLELEGVLQVATFHPDYCFDDLSQDDVRNYTNRSIYPMFHLIREDSVEGARAMHPDIDLIPDQNMEKLMALGLNKINKQLSACYLKK